MGAPRFKSTRKSARVLAQLKQSFGCRSRRFEISAEGLDFTAARVTLDGLRAWSET